MNAQPRRITRCAIYTRKSSEEGLEQSFNSLDAQREACQAFIASQRQEAWRPLSTRYDDGGYSGATMQRPALARLLEDVASSKVDTIVVYKVDRLTRSLADFAKIVEALDARGVSFVSVTQQFNTTSSMGRLTLNVLLSFAQFEREVTGERIRDKIAASKRKGMWMGGRVPLGYDLKDRRLEVKPEEAQLVCNIYSLYLELGSVSRLKVRLDADGIKSKVRVSAAGNRSGGAALSRGALYELLKNPLYAGEIAHRDQRYPGEHKAIVSRDLWHRVQAQLLSDHQGRRNGLRATSPSLLVGLLYDEQGTRFTPSHTLKNGKRYRYYVRRSVMGNRGEARGDAVRLPAHDIECLVLSILSTFLRSEKEITDQLSLPEDTPAATKRLLDTARCSATRWLASAPGEIHQRVRKVVRRVVISRDGLEVQLSKTELRRALLPEISPASATFEEDIAHLKSAATLKRRGCEMRVVAPPGSPDQVRSHLAPSLIKAVARAHDWYQEIVYGRVHDVGSLARQTRLTERYVRRVLQCAFLAPDIVEAVLDGRQPQDLTLRKLWERVPVAWPEQRKQFGFSADPAPRA